MATSASSPALAVLAERLLGPLVRATDDAMRRLGLEIDADVDADPAAGLAAPSAVAAWPAAVAETWFDAGSPHRAGVPRQPPGAAKVEAHPQAAAAVAPGQPAGLMPASVVPVASPGREAASATPEPVPSPAPLPAQGPAAPGQGLQPVVSSTQLPPDSAHLGLAVRPAQPGDLRTLAEWSAVAGQPGLPSQAASLPAPAHGWTAPVLPPAGASHAMRHGAALPALPLEFAAAGGSSAAHRARSAPADEAAASVPPAQAETAPLPLPAAASLAPVPAPRLHAGAAPSFSQAPVPEQAPTSLPVSSTIGPTARAPGLRVRPSAHAAVAAAWAVPGEEVPGPWQALAATRPIPALPGSRAGPEPALPPSGSPPGAPPLRLVANRLDRALAPVFSRALDASQPLAERDDADDAPAAAPARISNTFNVKVALGGAAGAMDARQIEEALGDWLRASARRQGLLP